MTLFSTTDDFCRTTLENISGVFGKLDYLAGLRGDDGRYQHWGLTRVYGEEAAQRAMAEAHRLVFLEILRMPLPRLIKDLARASGAQELGLRNFLEDLHRRLPTLVPPELGGGSVKHFNSVVLSLLTLARNSSVATPAGASQPPQPVQ